MKRGELPRAGYVVGGWLWALEATASQCVFHALSTITTLDLLPPTEHTFLSCVIRRLSGYRHYWHAKRSYCIHTQHALAIVGSHGHLSDRLRRGLCAITGCCQNEDLASGQRDRMRLGTLYTAKLLTRLPRCPLFPQPPPNPPCSITMSTSPTALTTKKEKRCDTCAVWLSSARPPTAYNFSLTSCESPSMENTTSVRCTIPQHNFVAGRISD